jgi:hypothetical protein
MDPRLKIPGLALVSLSLTECVERDPGDGDDADPIVGEWHAVNIDGQKYPLVEADGPYTEMYGFDLRVEVDLRGVLVLAADADYDGYVASYEHGSTIVVDASEAPKYRIDVTRDFLGESVDSYDPTGVVTGYDDTGYVGTDGYDSATATSEPTSGEPPESGTSYDPYGGPELPDAASPLKIPLAPSLAPAEMVLRCTLDADVLNCKRDGSEKPLSWVFERDDEPVPVPAK